MTSVEEYLRDQGLLSGGTILGEFDEYGRPVYMYGETIDDW